MSGARCIGIELGARDVPVLAAFYCEAFGFIGAADRGGATLHLGDCELRLRRHLDALPPDGRSNDAGFRHLAIVVADMPAAVASLRAFDTSAISDGAQTLPARNRAAAGIEAFYFRDPEAHPLELIWFPPDKGDARWHQYGAALFLGVDHSAIVVADTAASVSFYQRLGLVPQASSVNEGDEQAGLSGVPGARVRVTALRGDGGLGIELLEYLAPVDGQALPAGSAGALQYGRALLANAPGAPAFLVDPDGYGVTVT